MEDPPPVMDALYLDSSLNKENCLFLASKKKKKNFKQAYLSSF